MPPLPIHMDWHGNKVDMHDSATYQSNTYIQLVRTLVWLQEWMLKGFCVEEIGMNPQIQHFYKANGHKFYDHLMS